MATDTDLFWPTNLIWMKARLSIYNTRHHKTNMLPKTKKRDTLKVLNFAIEKKLHFAGI